MHSCAFREERDRVVLPEAMAGDEEERVDAQNGVEVHGDKKRWLMLKDRRSTNQNGRLRRFYVLLNE